jgi:hypothetical protein
MFGLSHWVARRVWGFSLWLLRRRPLKRLRRSWVLLLPPRLREPAWRAHVRQDRFARRYGVPILTVSFVVFFASLIVAVGLYAAAGYYETQSEAGASFGEPFASEPRAK